MSILRAPQLTYQYDEQLSYEENQRNLWLDYLDKQTTIMKEFAMAFVIIIVLGVIGLVISILL